MAKKVKKKLEEDEDYKSFQFPHFDVVKFIHYELEQTSATIWSLVWALGMSIVSWRVTLYGDSMGYGVAASVAALTVGIVVMAILPFFIRWAREKAVTYRTGDWATLLVVYLFLWLGIWNLLLNI